MPLPENIRLRERGEYPVEEIEPVASPSVAGIRAARLQEAPELSELCVRSKAVWGYDKTFMALARAVLEVRPEHIDAGNVWVATTADGSIAGIVALGPGNQPHTLDLEIVGHDFQLTAQRREEPLQRQPPRSAPACRCRRSITSRWRAI